MDFFNTAFYHNSLAFNNRLKEQRVIPITFPEFSYIRNNDTFWRELWKTIDEAKSYIWLMTYTYDSSVLANHTFKKLIEAQKRGVKVCLMIDDLNNRADKQLAEELKYHGGIVHSLNKIAPYWVNLKLSREMFQRHHEKLFIADEVVAIGSSNISDEYSGAVYGSFEFIDMNIFLRNICLSEVRSYFGELAKYYNYNLDKTLSNKDVLDKLDQQFANSLFNHPKVSLIKTKAPHVEEIQDFIISKINSATDNIKIIQPYYYPIRKFEKALVAALKRGISVEFITAAKRDQPAYAPLKNLLLMNELVKNGLKVYEINDKLLHMKLYQFDDKLYTSGSFNNDWWSWDINNELNIVVEGRQEGFRMSEIFQDVKRKATPLDPNMSIGIIRYAKLKFWENFLSASDWIMNKKRHYKAEKKYIEYREFKRTLREKDDKEAVEALKKLKAKKYRRIFMDWDDGLGNKF